MEKFLFLVLGLVIGFCGARSLGKVIDKDKSKNLKEIYTKLP